MKFPNVGKKERIVVVFCARTGDLLQTEIWDLLEDHPHKWQNGHTGICGVPAICESSVDNYCEEKNNIIKTVIKVLGTST